MDKDEQAPNTPPETPEVEKTEPAKAAPEIKITDEPKVETTEAPVEEKKDVAAEMDKLLNDEAAAPAPAPQPMMGKKHNHVGIIIILSLLVLAAVGFAIFEYLTAQNVKCECQKCETVECNCENEEEEEEEETSSADYIYVGEWGIKIKKPKDWANYVSYYSFVNGDSDDIEIGDVLIIVEQSDAEVEPVIEIAENAEACKGVLEGAETTCIEVGEGHYLDVLVASGITDVLKSHFEDAKNYSEI